MAYDKMTKKMKFHVIKRKKKSENLFSSLYRARGVGYHLEKPISQKGCELQMEWSNLSIHYQTYPVKDLL